VKNKFVVTVVLSLMLSGLTPLTLNAQYEHVQSKIHNFIENSTTRTGLWSVSVRDTLGNHLLEINSDHLIRPASNTKLLTSAAILDGLGSDFTFRTYIYGDGILQDSTWIGDIHIAGSGDPSIDGEFYEDDPFFAFNSLIDQIREFGINRIEGNLYGNESLFDDIPYPRGWEWDDLSYYYAPEISALSFNRNCVDLVVEARGRAGDTPSISWFPFDTDYVTFVNEQLITPANIRFNESYRRILGTNTILLRSTLPAGHRDTESLSVHDPALYFIDTFRKQAEKKGVQWIGELIPDRDLRNWDDFVVIGVHESKPLGELIKRLNRNSDNFYTEMLTKALAAYSLKTEGTSETGIELIYNFLEDHQIPEERVRLRDASGMAGANLLKTYDLSLFLQNMMKKSWFDAYLDSFAVAGDSGTLSHRFIGSPLQGNMQAKTGFVSGVRSLSGYMTTQDGNTIIFSIITNNFVTRVATVDRVHTSILETLYREL